MKVWTNVPMSNAETEWLREAVMPHELVVASVLGANNLTAGASDPNCVASDIVFGQPSVDDLQNSSTIKWVHITSAGFTRYDNAELKSHFRERGMSFTNSSSVYDDPCAQHVLSFMLAHSRVLPSSFGSESWQYARFRPLTRVLRGDKVLLVGYGAIAKRLIELLKPFNVECVGLRRNPSGKEEVPCHSIAELDKWLPWADHVVNILPLNPESELLFDKGRFEKFKPESVFYNIGRGDTVNQNDLADALTSRKVSAAYLDVTTPEPLPADHKLWSTTNCFITPHIGGGLQNENQELLDHFVRNLRRFSENEQLIDRVF